MLIKYTKFYFLCPRKADSLPVIHFPGYKLFKVTNVVRNEPSNEWASQAEYRMSQRQHLLCVSGFLLKKSQSGCFQSNSQGVIYLKTGNFDPWMSPRIEMKKENSILGLLRGTKSFTSLCPCRCDTREITMKQLLALLMFPFPVSAECSQSFNCEIFDGLSIFSLTVWGSRESS